MGLSLNHIEQSRPSKAVIALDICVAVWLAICQAGIPQQCAWYTVPTTALVDRPACTLLASQAAHQLEVQKLQQQHVPYCEIRLRVQLSIWLCRGAITKVSNQHTEHCLKAPVWRQLGKQMNVFCHCKLCAHVSLVSYMQPTVKVTAVEVEAKLKTRKVIAARLPPLIPIIWC